MTDTDQIVRPAPASAGLPLSRRDFMRLVALTAAGSLLGACQQPPAASQPKPTSAPAAAPTPVPTFARPQAESAPAGAPAAAPTTAAAVPSGLASGQIVIVQGVDIVTIDPPKSVSLTDQTMLVNVWDTLFTRAHDMTPTPGLATSFRNVDPTTWEFKLRQGVKFHNGEEFDADSVKFTIDRVLNPNTKTGYLSWFEGVKGVEIVDKHTVHIKTDGPNAALPMRVSTHPAMMLPPKHFQQVGEEAFFQKPIGTGPYKFVEWVKNDHLTIESNPDYWGPERPVYQTVTYKPAPEASTRLAMLQTGQADIITNLPPDMARSLEADQRLGVATVPGAGIIMYQLNTFS
jgi:peptide/nickel transport system substrate-binding protein